jgi:hypothetical protein
MFKSSMNLTGYWKHKNCLKGVCWHVEGKLQGEPCLVSRLSFSNFFSLRKWTPITCGANRPSLLLKMIWCTWTWGLIWRWTLRKQSSCLGLKWLVSWHCANMAPVCGIASAGRAPCGPCRHLHAAHTQSQEQKWMPRECCLHSGCWRHTTHCTCPSLPNFSAPRCVKCGGTRGSWCKERSCPEGGHGGPVVSATS